MPLFSVPIYANPFGGEVITGDVTIHEATGGTLNIDQFSDRAIIEWQNFSIDSGELTQFFQPGTQAAILNRVTGGSPSQINGALRANGNVWLINQNGVLFGAGSTVDVFGLVGSTLDVSNEAFMSGGDIELSGGGLGDTVNFGTINAVGGDVFLVGRSVANHGAIGAVDGTVGLAAGNRVLLKALGSERVFVSAGEGSVTNTGEIRSAMAELKAHGNVGALAINNTGVVRVSGAGVDGGRVVLSAANGNVSNTGEISARNADGSGGGIEIHAGMGEIHVGGILNASGSGNIGGSVGLAASSVRVDTGASVMANGTEGGQIQVGVASDVGRVEVMTGASVTARGEVGNGGNVAVTAGEVVFYPNSTLGAEGEVEGGTIGVQSNGRVQADGLLLANGRVGNGGLVDLSGQNVLIGQTGIIQANGGAAGGTVELHAVDGMTVAGNVSATGNGGIGGTVNVTGDEVNVGPMAVVDASGATGGGNINIGGGFQGRVVSLRNSSKTNVAAGAVIRADATQSGNGGQIAVWSDGETDFRGFASVAGVGNGGVVEVSGLETLTYSGSVDLSGGTGENGFLLLDPVDVTIGQVNSDGSTVGDGNAAAGSAQEPGLGAGVIDADALIAAWNSGNVVVHTSGVGSGVGKIDIESDVQIIGNNSNSLSFFAHEDINVAFNASDRGATQIVNHGSGNINLVAGWDGGGVSLFGPNLVANADPSNVVDQTSSHALAPSGAISAADLRAGTYGSYGDAGDINLNPDDFYFQVEIGSAGGETNLFARNLIARVGNETDEHVHIGFNTSHYDAATTSPVTGDINIELLGSSFLTSTGSGERYIQIGHGAHTSDATGTAAAVPLSGDITFNAEGILQANGGGGNGYVLIGHGGRLVNFPTMTGDINVNASALFLNAGTSNQDFVQIGHGGQQITGTASGAVVVNAGYVELNGRGNDGFAHIGHGGWDVNGDHTGPTTVTGKTILLSGGTASDSFAMIGLGGFNSDGNMVGDVTVVAEQRLEVTGGSGNDHSFALIGNGGDDSSGNHSGAIDVTTSLLTISSLDSGNSSGARVGHGGFDAQGNFSGAITINASGGIEMNSGGANDGANRGAGTITQIGHGGYNSDGDHSGRIEINSGTISVQGGVENSRPAIIGHGGQYNDSNLSGDIVVNSTGSISLIGGGALGDNTNGERTFAMIGHSIHDASVGGTVTGNITVTAVDDITLTGGVNHDSNASIGHGGTLSNVSGLSFGTSASPSDIVVRSTNGSIILNGGGDDGGGGGESRRYATIGHGGAGTSFDAVGSITVEAASNVTVAGGDGTFAYAAIGHGAGESPSSAPINVDGSITVDAGGTIDVLGGISPTGRSNFAQIGHFAQGTSVELTTSAASNVTVMADGDITMQGNVGSGNHAMIGHGGNAIGDVLTRDTSPILNLRGDVEVVTAGNLFILGGNEIVNDISSLVGEGLLQQIYSNSNTLTPSASNLFQTELVSHVLAGDASGTGPWAVLGDNETIVYHGQFYDADGFFGFAENIDDRARVIVDGNELIVNNTWSNATSSLGTDNGNTGAQAGTIDFGMGTNGDGWHDIQFIFANGGGGAGASGRNDGGAANWTSSVGFGIIDPSAPGDLGTLTNILDYDNYDETSTFASVPTFNDGTADYTSRFRVTATTTGLDEAATTGARGSFAQIGHGGAGNNSSAFPNINMSGDIDIRVGESIDLTNGSGEDAYAKIGHGDNLLDNPVAGIRSYQSGDISVAAGDDLNMTGGMIGHAQSPSVRLESISNGNTFVAVSRDPASNGQGNLTIIDDIGDGSGNVGVITSGSSGALRIYMTDRLPAGETPGTVDNNQIASGTLLNGSSYLHPTTPTLGSNENIAQEFGFTRDANGRPLGSFGPVGDLVGSGYTIFYSGEAVSVPGAPGRGGKDSIPLLPRKSVASVPFIPSPTPTTVFIPTVPEIPNFRPTFELNIPSTESFDQSEFVLNDPDAALNPAFPEVENPVLLDGDGIRGRKVSYQGGSSGSTGGVSTGQIVGADGITPLGERPFNVDRSQGSISVEMEANQIAGEGGGATFVPVISTEDDELRRRQQTEG